MIKRILPDGNIYYIPNGYIGFNANNIEKEIDEIYNNKNPHYYEKYYKLKKGMTVVDAGAYTGIFTLKASKAVGPKGRVIAFEPFQPSFNVLTYNIKKNKCDNVILINKGLGENICNKKLIVGKDYIGASILIKHNSIIKRMTYFVFNIYMILSNKKKRVNVELTTLDNIIDTLNIKKIDFLKIDIEGYEIKALLGYTKITKDNILVLETHQNLDKILYLIKEKGYNMDETYIKPINGTSSIIHTKF
jgi:FkbM family methyltransferase